MSEDNELLKSLHNGTISLDEVAPRFRKRSWPQRMTSPPETIWNSRSRSAIPICTSQDHFGDVNSGTRGTAG